MAVLEAEAAADPEEEVLVADVHDQVFVTFNEPLDDLQSVHAQDILDVTIIDSKHKHCLEEESNTTVINPTQTQDLPGARVPRTPQPLFRSILLDNTIDVASADDVNEEEAEDSEDLFSCSGTNEGASESQSDITCMNSMNPFTSYTDIPYIPATPQRSSIRSYYATPNRGVDMTQIGIPDTSTLTKSIMRKSTSALRKSRLQSLYAEPLPYTPYMP